MKNYLYTSILILTLIFVNGCLNNSEESSQIVTPSIKKLTSIAISPSSSDINVGNKEIFIATGYYNNGTKTDITDLANWSSSNPNIASIGTESSSYGIAHAKTSGKTIISASLNNIAGKATLTVNNKILQAIEISADGSLYNIPIGYSLQFKATAIYTDYSKEDVTNSVIWNSLNTKIATIDQQGLALGVAAGDTKIKAVLGSFYAQTPITITTVQLESIAINPTAVTIFKGMSQQFTINGYYSDKKIRDITRSTGCKSSNNNIAKNTTPCLIDSNTGFESLGAVTITATNTGYNVTANLTVESARLMSIDVTPINISIPLGFKQQFTAIAKYSNKPPVNVTKDVRWQSNDANIIQFNDKTESLGVATTKLMGNTTIFATFQTLNSNLANITVGAAKLMSMKIIPNNNLAVSRIKSIQLKAEGSYSDLTVTDIANLVTWSVKDSNNNLKISKTGLLSAGDSYGNAIIEAKYNNITSSVTASNSLVTAVYMNDNDNKIYVYAFEDSGNLMYINAYPENNHIILNANNKYLYYMHIDGNNKGWIDYCAIANNGQLSDCKNAYNNMISFDDNTLNFTINQDFVYTAFNACSGSYCYSYLYKISNDGILTLMKTYQYLTYPTKPFGIFKNKGYGVYNECIRARVPYCTSNIGTFSIAQDGQLVYSKSYEMLLNYGNYINPAFHNNRGYFLNTSGQLFICELHDDNAGPCINQSNDSLRYKGSFLIDSSFIYLSDMIGNYILYCKINDSDGGRIDFSSCAHINLSFMPKRLTLGYIK